MKRRQESTCVYVASNGARDDALAAPSPRSVRAYSRRAQPSRSPPVASPPPTSNNGTPTPATAPTGYLGYTSYCSVFEEAESALAGSTLVPTDTTTPDQDGARAGTSSFPELTPKTLDACLTVLNNVPEVSAGIESFRHPSPFDSFPHAVAKRIFDSCCETLGQYLGRDRSDQLQLELVARKLCANTARPFSETEPDADKWIAQLLGDNLRWESVGILFTYWGKKKTETREAVGLCADLCAKLSHGNSLQVYLTHRNTNAESCFSGDASMSHPSSNSSPRGTEIRDRAASNQSLGLRTWKSHSDTVSLLTFLGLHAETNPPDYEPTLASEFRRSLYAWVYCLDMAIVSFTGRPPLLSSAYASTPLPLDLSHEVLLSDKDSRAEAVRGLDGDG
ncbi:fungal specific transcription factor domain-containing protein, partial [Candidatus Bathyarchaeota archaeon]|nr:fungal specific transcription factor domain-containing protein [Candidatus Bathyarchaeota archaeon]